MTEYTVLVLKPEYTQQGTADEWVFQAHVSANGLGAARSEAIEEARRISQHPAADYAILAVYRGFLLRLHELPERQPHTA